MYKKIEEICGFDIATIEINNTLECHKISMPSEEYSFLHELAIIEYKNVLFCSWYNNERYELSDRTPIRFTRSFDGAKTWEEPKTVVDDPSKKILYCPPVFGECDGNLYMLLNQMVGPDLIHSLDLYIYDEASEQFNMLWSRPIPFKLNTNVYSLDNGKLILPGRIAELDGFPNTPAVLISDSGKIDAEWRLVKIQENGNLPGGDKLEHPELSLIIQNETIYAFCRNDYQDYPLVYISKDYGESWDEPYTHDIPFRNSKIYSGSLKNGKNYLIGNIVSNPERARNRLAIFFTDPNSIRFNKGFLVQDATEGKFEFGNTCHYPAACEYNGKLYVVYSADGEPCDTATKRGAVITVIDLSEI